MEDANKRTNGSVVNQPQTRRQSRRACRRDAGVAQFSRIVRGESTEGLPVSQLHPEPVDGQRNLHGVYLCVGLVKVNALSLT